MCPAAINEGNGERIDHIWKFLDILINLDARFIDCKSKSITTIHNTLAWVVYEEEYILFEVCRMLGVWKKLFIEYNINLVCCLVNHLDGFKVFHLAIKERLHRFNVFFCTRKALIRIYIGWWAYEQCLHSYLWNIFSCNAVKNKY